MLIEEISIIDSVIVLNSNLDWLQPTSTEKFYLFNHIRSNKKNTNEYYIGFPWASLIDFKENFEEQQIKEIKKIISQKNKRHTVCQHIKWRNLVGLWEN